MSGSPAGQGDAPPGSPPRGERVYELSLKALPVVAGLLGVLAAYLGVLAKETSAAKDQVQSDAATVERELREENERLSTEVARLRSELDRVKATAGESGSGGALPATSSDGGVPGTELRRGTLTLTKGYCADLDGPEQDWQVTSDCPSTGAIRGEADLGNSSGLSLRNFSGGEANADFALVRTDDPDSYELCRGQTGYTASVNLDSLTHGLRLCVRTTARNYALLRVDELVSPTGILMESITFSVVVWKG